MNGSVNANNKRIAKNTIFMYFRMFFMMVIALFTSRINLQSLGIQDYGIYNVVGGFVAMFSVSSNSFSAAIQRFIAYELGKGNKERLNLVFSTSVTIQIIIAIILMVLAEIIGMWFVCNKMILPGERVYAATWVLHCSVITFGIGLISVPYNAAIVAHERMSAFAYISIYEVISKLLICYLLFVSPIDKLITWAIMLALLQLSVRVIYGLYCGRNFEECQYKPILDKQMFKEIASYAGWSSFGLVALTCYTQGLNLILNLFFGPIVNAARGIAVQVQNAVQGFSTNFQLAMNPQIIKSYAQHEFDRLCTLLHAGTRFSYYLLLLLSLPIVLETPQILSLWLGEYPDHTINFIRLILILILFDSSFGGPMSTVQTATGNIKLYQIIIGGLMLSILPISYLILKIWHTAPETVYIVYMVIAFIAQLARMLIIRGMINLSLRRYAKETILPILLVTITSLPVPLFVYWKFADDSLWSFLIVCSICILSVVSSIAIVGLTQSERKMIASKIRRYTQK